MTPPRSEAGPFKHIPLVLTCALAMGAALNGSLAFVTTAAPASVVLAALGCLGALLRSQLQERTGRCHPLVWWAFFGGFIFSSGLPRSPLPPLSVTTHSRAALRQSSRATPRRDLSHDDDATLFDALDRIDRDAQSVLGTWVQVSGTWTRAHDGAPATVSRQIMTCCAADAVSVGFDVIPQTKDAATRELPASGASVHVSGRLRASMADGETRYSIGSAIVTVAR